jgi:outer membrane scaffolding protein for murein synthesis (MipA/OmpV family)
MGTAVACSPPRANVCAPFAWIVPWLVCVVGLALWPCPGAGEDLTGIIGVGPVSIPRYASGQDHRVSIAPFYIIGWGERFDLDSFNGATLWVAKLGDLKLGPNLTYAPGIYRAPGLDHISARPTVGVRVEWDITPWFDVFTGAGREILVPDHGATANVGAEALYEFGSRWYGYSGARLIWGNALYQQNYFGVSSAEAAHTSYPVYSPGAGLSQFALDQYLGFKFTEHWGMVAGFSYGRLLGPSADSPTVALGGKPNQWLYGVFLGYKF